MKGKVAVVTASSTGIGKGIIKRLGEEGCSVIVSSRKQVHIDETVKELKQLGIKAVGCVCHVGKAKDRQNLLEFTMKEFGRIDYLVLNAAVSTHMGNFLDATEEQIKKMWEINLISSFLLVKEALPYLKKQPGSSIVVLSSYSAYESSNMIGHYAITKTALVALTKALARQLQEDEIRVNAVAPGLIKTDFSKSLWENGQQATIQAMGLKRLGQSRDIAHLVKFLLSDEASYITGECIVAAGRTISRL